MTTSPNVVPFPAMPVRAADERFEELVDQYAGILRCHLSDNCPRHLGVSINDIEQEALVRLWRVVRGDKRFFFKAAVTTTIDAVRRAIARRDQQRTDAAHGESLTLLHALGNLPATERRFAELHLQGFETSDIAALLRCSESKARRMIDRAMDTLRA